MALDKMTGNQWAMSNEEAKTKEQNPLNFQRDMLLQVQAIEDKVYTGEPTKKLLYTAGLSELILTNID